MKTYTIIGGVNGSGKSSLSGVLVAERKDLGAIINVDEMVFEQGISSLEAGKAALNLIKQLMKKGVNFTQETTLSGVKTLQTIKRAQRRGYYVRMYYVGLDDVGQCIQRVRQRAANGGHFISESDIMRRYKHRFDSLMRVLPHCDEVSFYDNRSGFIEVGKMIDGQLIFRGSSTPKWLIELSTYIQRAKDESLL